MKTMIIIKAISFHQIPDKIHFYSIHQEKIYDLLRYINILGQNTEENKINIPGHNDRKCLEG